MKKAEKALEQDSAEVKTVLLRRLTFSTRSKMPRATLRKRISHPVKALQIQSNKLQPLTTPQPPRLQKRRAAAVLTEAAAQIAASPSESRATLDEAVADASGEPSLSAKEEAPQVKRGRPSCEKN